MTNDIIKMAKVHTPKHVNYVNYTSFLTFDKPACSLS